MLNAAYLSLSISLIVKIKYFTSATFDHFPETIYSNACFLARKTLPVTYRSTKQLLFFFGTCKKLALGAI